MPLEETEEELEEVKDRRSKGFNQTLKNLSNIQYISIIVLIIILFYLIKNKTSNFNIALIVIGILGIFFWSQKTTGTTLISGEVATKIAKEYLENKKEEYDIPSGTDIKPTNFCHLQHKSGEPFKWHIGIKLENTYGKINHWRVVVHPYLGIVMGVADEPTGFSGKNKEVSDVVVVFPEHFMKEK